VQTGKAISFADDFDEYPLPAQAIELTMEDLPARAETELSISDCRGHVMPHDLAFNVCVCMTPPVSLWRSCLARRQLFEPDLVVMLEACGTHTD
jgi:hypothetical protein